MRKTFYTLWKAREHETDEALLLDSEPLFHTKKRAFRKAEKLAKDLAKGWDYVILVRKITIGSDMCTEWVFSNE